MKSTEVVMTYDQGAWVVPSWPMVVTGFWVNEKRYEVHDCRIDPWGAFRPRLTEDGGIGLEMHRASGWYSWWEPIKMTEIPERREHA